MTKNKLLMIACVPLLIGAGYISFAMAGAEQPGLKNTAPQTTPQVQVVQPSIPETQSQITFNARLTADKEAALYARGTGFVQERLVDIGDTVEQGQLLARLTAPELDAELNAQKAQLALAQAELRLARSNLERAKSLSATGAVSKASLDTAQADLSVKSAMVKAREAQVSATRAEIEFLTVTAPFKGSISQRNIEQGDKVSPEDNDPLYRIINKDSMRVIVDIPQTQYFQIDKAVPADLIVSELGGQKLPVTFSRSSKDIDQSSGTVQVEYSFDNREAALLSGLNVQIAIPVEKNRARLIIPNSVLINRAGQVFVFAVDDDNTLIEKPIETGRSFSNEIEVISGLAPTDRLVVNPNGLFKNGDVVEVLPPPPAEEKK